MNRRTRTILIILVGCAAVLSIPFSSLVEVTFIQPIIRFFWILTGYYGSIDQSIIWILTLILMGVIMGFGLRAATLLAHHRSQRSEKLPGDVGQLAFWIRRSKHGPYPHWYLARVLADLATDLLRRRGSDPNRNGDLQGPGWDPPGDITAYLSTALRTTPATFNRNLEKENISKDPELDVVIHYLEEYMEKADGNQPATNI